MDSEDRVGPDASGTSKCCTSDSSGAGMSSPNAVKSSSESLRVATDKGDDWGTIGNEDSGSRIRKSSSDDRAELGVAKTSKGVVRNISKTNGTSCEIRRLGIEGHDGRMPVGTLGTRSGGVSKAGATLPGVLCSKSESEVRSNGPETSRRGRGVSRISSMAWNFVLGSFSLSSSTVGMAMRNSLSDGSSTDRSDRKGSQSNLEDVEVHGGDETLKSDVERLLRIKSERSEGQKAVGATKTDTKGASEDREEPGVSRTPRSGGVNIARIGLTLNNSQNPSSEDNEGRGTNRTLKSDTNRAHGACMTSPDVEHFNFKHNERSWVGTSKGRMSAG